MGLTTRCVKSCSALRSVVCGAGLLAAACSSNLAPSPTVNPPSDSPISVTGTEKLGWYQPADDANEVARMRYVGYVDDVPQDLADAACGSASTAGVFACGASLPRMSVGVHRLELVAENIEGLQSPKSAALVVNLIASKISGAIAVVSRAGTTQDGIQLIVETLAVGLTAPSALAVTPDGHVFIAERSGKVRIWEGGQLLPTPALELYDVVQTNDVGLVDVALHPDFQTNGRLFIAYTARDGKGAFVNRIVRLRDVGDIFGEAVVILEDRVPAAPPRPPRIRVGPDQVVYAAFSAGDRSTAESFASYEGKILRINEDGTTPRDNQGLTPIISSGYATTGGFDWQPGTARLWLAGRNWQGRDFVKDISTDIDSTPMFDPPFEPSGLAFFSNKRVAGFANDLFVGALAGRHVRRVHFSRADPGRIESTERLLDGKYGRISDVRAGPDGAIYISTSNVGTVSATADDDRLLRLTTVN
jgi:aldose sugar dehydrogenase